jgi:hypothetical protein
MSHGLAVYNAAGVEIMRTPDVSGGVFVGSYTMPAGSSGTFTFPQCAIGSLRVLQHTTGTHSWTISSSGGQPVINYTAYTPANGITLPTGIFVFTVDPTLSAFGFIANNLLGERVVDSTFVKPEFLGKFSLSAVGGPAAIQNAGWNRQNYQSATQTVGTGRTRIVLYDFPDTGSNDVYFAASTALIAPGASSFVCAARAFYATGASWSVPQAYVFAIDGLAAGGGWGLQVFNASGQLTYEASKSHMNIRALGNGYAYPVFSLFSYSFTPNSYGLPTLPAGPAAFLTPFSAQRWEPTGPLSSESRFYEGGMRRSGSTLFTRIFHVTTFTEDAAFSGENYYGSRENIALPVIAGGEY